MRKALNITGICLLAFVLCCRLATPVADFYATCCYPAVSAVLSLMAAAFPFSLEEISATGFAAAFITVLAGAVRKHSGFWKWLRQTACIAIWLVVWFYMGWGNNYFRTPLYQRIGIEPARFDETSFKTFLADFTEDINALAADYPDIRKEQAEDGVKTYYAREITACGYTSPHSWQHVKKPLVNPLYSAAGVLGFMGPFFCETQVNLDVTAIEYPYVMAHETAHLAGVTSEAEASYWAYAYCRQSDDLAVRYSGCLSLLPYVTSQAMTLLPEDEFEAWKASLSVKAVADYSHISSYWKGKRVAWIDKLQRAVMDTYLKSNNVTEGAADYKGVIGILMTMDARESE